MDTIVLGFDGSGPSFVALDWVAERAAKRSQCRVEIVTVDAAAHFSYEEIDVALDEAERRLRNVARDAEIETSTRAGRMPEALFRIAAQADLLVVGAHRGRPVRSALTGWRPLRTASRSTVPVVVVPDDWRGNDGPILVGVDDDESSSSALLHAASEAIAAGETLTMLHAWRMPGPLLDGSMALLASPLEEKERHRGILDAAVAVVRAAHADLAVNKLLVQDNPTTALLTQARVSSLLVLGTHHRGLIAGSFFGSVGQDALVGSRIPVCVVPTTDAAEHRASEPDAEGREVDRLRATGDGLDRERAGASGIG